MRHDWVLTQESFDSLLSWLSEDRNQAALKYETIRLRLIKILTCRGCAEADELADETINRVTAKVGEIATTYSGDPALYFYAVAQKVYLEYLRRKQVTCSAENIHLKKEPEDTDGASGLEDEFKCLETCIGRLSDANRQLVLDYYREDKRAKIDQRKKLADELGIAVNALRIRAHRIRLQLQHCVKDCLAETVC